MTGQPQSNHEFLTGIFGDLAPTGPRPTLCALPGDPKTARGTDWAGWRWYGPQSADAAGCNWFFTLAVHHGSTRRRRVDCAAIYGVMLDDLGTKAPPPDR